MAFIVAGTGAYALSRFADQAFADSLGLRTVRVGTDPLTWVSSHLVGKSPTIDLSKTRPVTTPLYVGNMTDEYGIDFDRIFTLIDQQLAEKIEKLAPGWFKSIAFTLHRWVLHNYIVTAVNGALKSISPWLHGFFFKSTPLMWIFRKCAMHTVSYMQKTADTYQLIKGNEKSGNLRLVASISFSMIAALFTPTLKFRYKEAEAQARFKEWTINDTVPTTANVLLTTQQKLSPTSIGILGTLKNSFGLPSWSKASKVALGLTKLALAGAVAYGTYKLCPNFVESHKTALIAGAVFAVI
jgi:hypothetical protein